MMRPRRRPGCSSVKWVCARAAASAVGAKAATSPRPSTEQLGSCAQAMFAEDTAAHEGLLQRVDPRVKVVTLLGLLVAVSLVRSLPVLVVAYLATLVLAVLSRLPMRLFVRRVWLFIPIFTGIVVLPATLNVITAGHVVVPLGTWFGHELGITAEGLTSAAMIVTRVATSISLVVLLTLTTPWTRLLAALRALLVPRLFILVLGMAYRYLFHLLNSVLDMFTARRARRSATAVTPCRAGSSWPPALVHCSARRTRSPKRCTWRWCRAATPATLAPSPPSGSVPSTSCGSQRRSLPPSCWSVSAVAETLLDLAGVSYSYLGRFAALDDVSLTVAAGEKVALLGANGCGKSTLLKILDGLVFPDSGTYHAFDAHITEDHLEDEQFNRGFRSRIGFVFQNSDAQVFSPTVREEIAFGPLSMSLDTDLASIRVDDTLDMLDIGELADRAPHQLSGGEKKKVAIASVLVMNPEVLLFDEPTAALDPRTQQWLIELIIELNHSRQDHRARHSRPRRARTAGGQMRRVLRAPSHRRL